MKKMDITLAAFGVFFVGFGLVSLFKPVMIAQLLELTPNGTSGLNEIRAAYGGMFFGQGIVFCMACTRKPWLFMAWLFLAVSMGGLALGRIISFVADGMPGNVQLIAFVCETLMALIGFYRARDGFKMR